MIRQNARNSPHIETGNVKIKKRLDEANAFKTINKPERKVKKRVSFQREKRK